jgi:nucleoside-diphosphate-sugar epimerase
MIRVLITGPSGFIGRHCMERLLLEDCEIHAVNRSGSGSHNDHVAWHAADLRDCSQATELIAKVKPTHLLHGAWVATPRVYSHSLENIDWLHSGIAIASALGAHRGVRFVGIGSSAEYQPGGDTPCTEDDTLTRPATIYGKCKAACWLAVQAAAQHYGFSAAWGRLFLPYGPGDSVERLVPSVLAALEAGKPVKTTQGTQERDFIYAPDAADLLIRLLFSDQQGAFNIGTGRATKIRSVIEYLAALRGRPDLLQFGALAMAPNEPPVLVANMAKVRERFSWMPRTDLWNGLDTVCRCRSSRSV